MEFLNGKVYFINNGDYITFADLIVVNESTGLVENVYKLSSGITVFTGRYSMKVFNGSFYITLFESPNTNYILL